MSWLRTSIALLVALVAIVLLVVRPDQMVVERVEVRGQTRATEAQVRHLADVRNGAPLWSVDLDAVSAGVVQHPWVARVEASRRLPGTIVVEVQEFEPVALLAYGGRLLYVDASGLPFLEADSSDLDHPAITGISPSLEAAHPALPRLVIRDALSLLDRLDATGLVERSRVSEVRFHRERGFTVVLSATQPGRPGAEILFDLSDHERQLDRLAVLAREGVDLSEPVRVDVAPRRVAIVQPLPREPRVLAP